MYGYCPFLLSDYLPRCAIFIAQGLGFGIGLQRCMVRVVAASGLEARAWRPGTGFPLSSSFVVLLSLAMSRDYLLSLCPPRCAICLLGVWGLGQVPKMYGAECGVFGAPVWRLGIEFGAWVSGLTGKLRSHASLFFLFLVLLSMSRVFFSFLLSDYLPDVPSICSGLGVWSTAAKMYGAGCGGFWA